MNFYKTAQLIRATSDEIKLRAKFKCMQSHWLAISTAAAHNNIRSECSCTQTDKHIMVLTQPYGRLKWWWVEVIARTRGIHDNFVKRNDTNAHNKLLINSKWNSRLVTWAASPSCVAISNERQ